MFRKGMLYFSLALVAVAVSGIARAADPSSRLQIDGPKENKLSITLRDVKDKTEPVVFIGGKQAKIVPGSLKPNADGSEYLQVELPCDIKPGRTTFEVKVGEEIIRPEPLFDIPDPHVAAGKQPLILRVQPAGGMEKATITITGRNFGDDLTKATVVVGEISTALSPVSISKPNDQEVQELVFAIPGKETDQFKQILSHSTICNYASLTVEVAERAANWEHLNIMHPRGLWKIAGLSLALVIMLLSPLLAVLWWRFAIASVLLVGGLLVISLIADKLWILAVLFTVAALGLLYLARANRDTLQPVLTTLFIDKDSNTYSLSKVQAFAWTVVIIGTYVYFAVGRGLLIGRAEIPDLSPGLLPLLSISYGGLILSRGISRKIPKNDFASTPPVWTDLITEGKSISITRLQLLGFTIAAIAVYLFYVTDADLFAKGLPEIPVTLSGLLGISQAGYLGGKVVSNRAVNYIIPRRARGEETIKIFGAGFVDRTKVFIQGVAEASNVKFVSSTSLEVKLPEKEKMGDAGLKQMVFIPPTDSSFVINDAFEIIDPKASIERLDKKTVAVTIDGVELAEGELRATVNGKGLKVIKKEGNQFTLEWLDPDPAAELPKGSTMMLMTALGDEIGSVTVP